MQALLAKAPAVRPRAIGIDEVAIRKRHTYRIVVSDLEAERPIWFGGAGRKEEDLDQFFAWLGPAKTAQLEIAVMDMWKAFRNSTTRNAPRGGSSSTSSTSCGTWGRPSTPSGNASTNASRQGPGVHQGQKYTLLSARANLDLEGRQALRKLLKANRRLQTAYCSGSPLGSSGVTAGKATPGASSRTGGPN